MKVRRKFGAKGSNTHISGVDNLFLPRKLKNHTSIPIASAMASSMLITRP